MPTVVKGPWKFPLQTSPTSTRVPANPLLLALLVALAVATFSYIGYQVATPVRPTPAIDRTPAGTDHPDGLSDGRYYPDDTLRAGVWQTTVPQGKTCSYASQSRITGPSEGVRTSGTLTVSVTSSNVWIEFAGGCLWFRVER